MNYMNYLFIYFRLCRYYQKCNKDRFNKFNININEKINIRDKINANE